jgi:ElaB/YqjD/DUF883 family membrane-anchored ribosome-binding protein
MMMRHAGASPRIAEIDMTTSANANGREASKVKGALASIGHGVSDVRSDVTHLAAAVGDEVKARAGKLMQAGRNTTHQVVEAARTQVREHPAQTLAIAAGAGILLGILIAARRH